MKKINPILIAMAFLALTPVLTRADYFSGDNWYNPPLITPTTTPNIIFPVQGGASFSDDFADPRSGGRLHEGNDLMAAKMTPILAAHSGVISFAPSIEPSYGYMLSIRGDDGYKYNYLHINNDTPGTDDGKGGALYAYPPEIKEGLLVSQGQHIAWVGDSGNAESTGSHLHFEIRLPDDTAIDPYPFLNVALSIYSFNVAQVIATSPTINTDKDLIANDLITKYCTPGSLIRTPEISSVYYCGLDGKRYVFPSARNYATWYKDFLSVKVISVEDMAKIMLGGNVTYRPGIKLVKIQTEPKVYAVDHNGTLRGISTPAVAAKYYGASWAKNVEDIPDTYFGNYKIGAQITN